MKTGADEDGEIETESNEELIGETLRVTEAAAAQQTEAAMKPKMCVCLQSFLQTHTS